MLSILLKTSSLCQKPSPQFPRPIMVNTKRLIEMARKWQKVAALGRRRITSSKNNCSEPSQMSSSMVARRGHLFLYSADGNRFMIPLAYLTEEILIKLFRISEEEFGLPGNGHITLPCDAASMEYIISLLRNRASNDVKRVMLSFIASNQCTTSSSLFAEGRNQQRHILCGF